MFTPPTFKKFGKGLDDLLKKKYEHRKELRVKSITRDGTTLESGVVYNGAAYSGRTKINAVVPGYGKAEVEADTTGKAKGSMEFDSLVKSVVAKFTVSQVPDATLEIDYTQPSYNVSATVAHSQTKSHVEAAAAVGFDGLSVGGSAKVNGQSHGVEDYNAGVQYQQNDFTGTIKTEDQADIVVGSYLHQVSREVEVGARFKYNINTNARLFTFGFGYQVDPETHVRAKVSSDANVETVFERRLASPLLTYALTSKFDAAKSHVPTEFGVLFQFGEK